MEKPSPRQISRTERNNGGCLWGLFNMFDFQKSCHSQRLLSNRQHGNVGFLDEGRYSTDVLDFLLDFEEKDAGSRLPGQSEDGSDALGKHTKVFTEDIYEVQQAENSSFAKDKHMPSSSGYENSSVHIHERNYSAGSVSGLDACDLAVPVSGDCPTLSVHSLKERFCDGLHLATLLQGIQIEKNKLAVECRKNSHYNASGNDASNETHICSQPEIFMDNGRNFLQTFGDDLLHAEEKTTVEVPHQSDDLLDMLKVLRSNEDLTCLLQESDSTFMRHIQKLQNSCRVDNVNNQFPQEQNMHNICKMGKSLEIQKPKSHVKRIVVLEPIPSRTGLKIDKLESNLIPLSLPSQRNKASIESRKNNFVFSFKELKNRLMYAVGEKKKERKVAPNFRDTKESGSLARNYGSQTNILAIDSCITKNHNDIGCQQKELTKMHNAHIDFSKDSAKTPRRSFCILEKESDFQKEAKKHLIEMFLSKDDCKHLPEKPASKALWNLLSLQEYKFSPAYIPGRNKESCLSPQMRFCALWSDSPQENHKRSNMAKDSSECPDFSSSNSDAGSSVPNLGSEVVKTNMKDDKSATDAASIEVMNNNEGTSDIACSTVEISDLNGHGIADYIQDEGILNVESKFSEEKKSKTHLLPCTLLIHGTEAPEIIMDKLERPSPVSVLTPPFVDDATCSGSPESEQREEGLPISPRELHFDGCNKSEGTPRALFFSRDLKTLMGEEEFKVEYVKSLLDASGLIHAETWERYRLLCNLLDSSLFNEVEIPSGENPYDPMLLFDRIGEVLGEIREKYFPQRPWAALVKHNVHRFPSHQSLVEEVCGRITQYHATYSEISLSQLTEKDLDAIVWIDISAEIDNLGTAIEDDILEEILDELVSDVSDLSEPCR